MAGQTRISVRRRRRPTKFRLRKPQWIDPFPGIPGTEPEKRLFEVLVRRRLYFVFQGELREFKEKDLPVLWQIDYKPDFVLPEYKVIIDPFGIYHHTLPEAMRRDYMKAYIYRSYGYAFYHPWWTSKGWEWNQAAPWLDRHGKKQLVATGFVPLGYDTNGVLDRIPELAQGIRFPLKYKEDIEAKRRDGYRLGENLGLGASSVAAANRRRRRPPVLTLRTRGRRRRRRS